MLMKAPNRKSRLVVAALLILAAGHAAFAWQNRGRRPDLAITSPPPAAAARQALALGDDQFLYRIWALDLQNAGDTAGRATPMNNYNYDHVIGWLAALGELDQLSHFHPFLAARYFSLTTNPAEVRRLIEFIVADASKSPERKWYWLTQAMEMAEHRLDDVDYALTISRQVAAYEFPGMPTWPWLFPAVLLKKLHRYGEAREVIETVRVRKQHALEHETLNWMAEFERSLPAE